MILISQKRKLRFKMCSDERMSGVTIHTLCHSSYPFTNKRIRPTACPQEQNCSGDTER